MELGYSILIKPDKTELCKNTVVTELQPTSIFVELPDKTIMELEELVNYYLEKKGR